jgi:hypothetical protein
VIEAEAGGHYDRRDRTGDTTGTVRDGTTIGGLEVTMDTNKNAKRDLIQGVRTIYKSTAVDGPPKSDRGDRD